MQNEPLAPGPPRLDEPAPYFEGRSAQGPVKLTDFAGKWLVFFAHPGADAVEPPPETARAADERRGLKGDLGFGCVDWYYYKRRGRDDRTSANR